MKQISFEVKDVERLLIMKIAKRAARELFEPNCIEQTQMATIMDLSACIAHGCRLRLEDLLNSDIGNFGHDVCGIRRHINRETGLLENCFLPRFASPATPQAQVEPHRTGDRG